VELWAEAEPLSARCRTSRLALGAAAVVLYALPATNFSHGLRMTSRLKILPVLFALAVTVAGCHTTAVQNDEYNDPRYTGPGALSPADSGITLFSTEKSKSSQDEGGGTGLGVNAFLWRASLDTMSFMPLASADPFGGVIITDWYQPPTTPGERFKVTAYIMGRQLRTDGLRVTVFRQVEQGGQWVDAPVNANTASEMEDKVLARARQLRSQATAAN